jgi:diguanylate cyclase (GGDEF)-like protein
MTLRMARPEDRDQAGLTEKGQVLLRPAPRARARRFLALVLLPLVLSLAACGQDESHAAKPATTASTQLAQALETIDRIGLARPQDQLAPLLALQNQAQKDSAEQLKAVTLRGLYAVAAQDKDALDAATRVLDAWPVGPHPAAMLAKALVQARAENAAGHLDQAVLALNQPALLDDQEIDAWLRWRAHQTLGVLLVDTGHFDKAAPIVHTELKLAAASGRPWQQAVSLRDQSWLFHASQQGEQARAAVEQALQMARSDPDPVLLQMVQTMRYIVYPDALNPAIVQEAAEAALEYARQANSEGMQALCMANLSDFHLGRSNYLKALALAEEALPLAKLSHKPTTEILALHNRGLAKIALNRVDEGYRDVLEALRLSELQGTQSSIADGWHELGSYLERAERWLEALQAFMQYRRRIEGVLRDETRKSLLEAQERYAAEQRAQEIELLNRGNSLKTEQIKARDLQLWLWAALAGCIVLLGTLLGLAYQRIRKTNLALELSNDTLKVQSERDPLTGLANRRHFQAAIKSLSDNGKLAGTVFLIDIDHFKRINDVHGHAAGDAVLIEVAQRLRSALREEDLVVRWGGEEFIIVVKTRESDLAQGLAQRLLDLIALPPVRHGGRDITVTASIGFASFPVAPHDLVLEWERAIDLVDTVMYLAKAHGRNKAYGVVAINARSQAEVSELSARMDAACGDGEVTLVALQGPPQFEVSRQ